MTNTEAIEKLERQKIMVCHGCVHPSMVGWCENHCRLPEAFDMAINALTAQPEKRTEERTETHSCDCVSRQAALDIERNATVDTNPSHFEAHQKFMQFMDDAEISSFGRWQWSNGFNTALTAVRIDLENLPSAQPERTCVNCGRTANNGGWYADGGTRCPIEEHYALPKDGFCHLWEKRNVTDDDYPERQEMEEREIFRELYEKALGEELNY